MPLYEYQCGKCKKRFEELVSISQRDEQRTCRHCSAEGATRVPSAPHVAGRGDLRESTLHGCHDATVSPGGHHCHGGCSHSKS